MVANVVAGDIRRFVSTLYTILSSKKGLQILTENNKICLQTIVYKFPSFTRVTL